MRNILFVMVLVLIVLMSSQWGSHLGGTKREIVREVTEVGPDGAERTVARTAQKLEGGVNVTFGDAMLVLVFLVWAGWVVARRDFLRVRLPMLAVFVFIAVVLASALHSRSRVPGFREFLQYSAYFVGGWLVFANCIDSRQRLRAAVGLFTLAVAAVVVIALCQYHIAAAGGSAFSVAGSFDNRNVLGAFLAVALPFVFSLALHERRVWQKFALMLTVAFGCMVALSGGALIALAVSLFFVASLRSRIALFCVVGAAALALTVVPAQLALPRHGDVVVSSVSPYLNSNYLDRRPGAPEPRTEAAAAVRYKRWHASLRLIKMHLSPPFLGVGPGLLNENLAAAYGSVEKPSGDTDVVAGFNIDANEPDSFNMYLVTCAESGPFALLALAWILVLLFGRNVRAAFSYEDEFGRALALGAAGAVAGAAVCSVFSSILVRGVVLPFIFVAVSGILWAKLSKLSDLPGSCPARPRR